MRNSAWALVLTLLLAHLTGAKPPQRETAGDAPPPWAYGFESISQPASGPRPAPSALSAKDDGSVRRLPDSNMAFTLTEINNPFDPPDWYPDDHPNMPEIVAHGRQPNAWACSRCHYPNGKGLPGSASISGLPYSYFVQTMIDFKNGARKSADSRKRNTNDMITIAGALTDDELRTAAEYFCSIKRSSWIRVIEADFVPKAHISGGFFVRVEGNETEEIGQRIIELPENTERTVLLRDSHAGFLAYVPMGSLKKGADLVVNGGSGKTTKCAVCHGPDLQGLGPVPGIAGRSPTYLARQIYDIQHHTRNGPQVPLMRGAVDNLNADDVLAIAAYLASLAP